MSPEPINKKKLSEYQIEDIKELFVEVFKKISSKVILLEFGNDFINIALAKSQKDRLYIKKILRQNLPKEALDKSLPSDPKSFGEFLKQVIKENKINTKRVAVCLPSDACYTRLIEIPEEVKEENSKNYVEGSNSGIQIPISLENSDFEINLSNLPKKLIKNRSFNTYFLTSLPKKNVDIIMDSINNANLEICSLQMSHNCIANLLKTELDKLNENDLIISVDLLDEFSQFVIFDSSGPLLIKRLASIRNYPSINEIKEINKKQSEKNKKSNEKNNSNSYHPLSKLDLKVLLREINDSFNNFLRKNNLNKKGKIFLSGRNSQHKNLVEILGENLKMDVSLISPINNFKLKEFSYNPDEINHYSMSRIIGLGLTLIRDNEIKEEYLNDGFIVKSFSLDKNIDKVNNDNILSKDINLEKNKIKENLKTKTKVEKNKKELLPLSNVKKIKEEIKVEKNKKELPPLPNIKKIKEETKVEENKKELPPLPNIKKIKEETKVEENKINLPNNQEKVDKKGNSTDKKPNKSFKIDKSFLKND